MNDPTVTMSRTMANPTTLNLAFWNVFLLKPRPIPGGPGLPAIGDLAAPAVSERAARIGEALSERFDIVAFGEAFEDPDRQQIVASWGSSTLETACGPQRSLRRGGWGFASSGLFTVVNGYRITRVAKHQFVTRGSYRYDADALANKGVLFVEIDLGAPYGKIEIASTHLIYGTGLLGGSTAQDRVRRHSLRMRQLDELVGFVRSEHRSENPLFVVGDFNVPAYAPDYVDGPLAQYQELTESLAALGVRDLWADHGNGDGFTCGSPIDDFGDQVDPDDPAALVDTPVTPADAALTGQRERIDYIFASLPESGWTINSMRRYAFPRAVHAPDRDRLVRLSDHLAIGVSLTLG